MPVARGLRCGGVADAAHQRRIVRRTQRRCCAERSPRRRRCCCRARRRCRTSPGSARGLRAVRAKPRDRRARSRSTDPRASVGRAQRRRVAAGEDRTQRILAQILRADAADVALDHLPDLFLQAHLRQQFVDEGFGLGILEPDAGGLRPEFGMGDAGRPRPISASAQCPASEVGDFGCRRPALAAKARGIVVARNLACGVVWAVTKRKASCACGRSNRVSSFGTYAWAGLSARPRRAVPQMSSRFCAISPSALP